MSASHHNGHIILYDDGTVNPNLPFPEAQAVTAMKIKSKGLADWILTYPEITYVSLVNCEITVDHILRIFSRAERLKKFGLSNGTYAEGKLSYLWESFLKLESLSLINVMGLEDVSKFMNLMMLGSSIKSLHIDPKLKDGETFRMIDVAAILQYTDVEDVFLCGELEAVHVEPIIHSLQNSKVKKVTICVGDVSTSAFHLLMHGLHRTNISTMNVYNAKAHMHIPAICCKAFQGPNWKHNISVWIDRVYIESGEKKDLLGLIRPCTAIKWLDGLGADGEAMVFLDEAKKMLHEIHGTELKMEGVAAELK